MTLCPRRLWTTAMSLTCTGVLLISGCASNTEGPSTAQLSKAPSVTFTQIGIDEVRADSESLVGATRRLGVAIAGQSAAGANRIVSPWSLMTALAMVRAGARGATADEIDRAAGPYTPRAVAALTGQVTAVGGDPGKVDEQNPPTPPVFRQATGVFAQKSYPIGKQYLVELSRYFDTGVYPVDFSTDQAQRAINEWTTVNTGSQITRAPNPPDKSTLLSLLSTVYLAAAWNSPFPAAKTVEQGRFSVTPDRVVRTPMMANSGAFRIAEGPGWTAIELPYGTGELAMQVVLPATGATTSTVLTDAVLSSVAAELKSAQPRTVDVTLPRWQSTETIDLRTALQTMGIRSLFTDRADLSGISPGLMVTRAAQSGTITVGEKGTVAAAVTKIDVGPTATPDQGIRFTADRPFVYQIVDTSTALPLFLGVVSDPRST
ncbi:serpin family protein [Williamsia sp. CHRR-6]|uniref:serpin family protein n=1 Tax=Williamsia sp. CHRR-6 TaxID=2835871 RepID=UPI001BD99A82|nr:serpin family protein [Williamsia sp. CHRR-6]MBT0566779.1 serpin family protein [Williamsia sp. CHRR-6]